MVVLKHITKRILQVCGLVMMSSHFGWCCSAMGNVLDEEAMAQAADIARVYLHANNLRDGIELVGGPFNLDEYAFEETALTSSKLYGRYVYKRPFSIPADPDTLTARVQQGGMNFDNLPTYKVSEGKGHAGFSIESCDHQTQEFLAQMPLPITDLILGWPDEKAQVIGVEIGDKIKIARSIPPICNIHSVKRLSVDIFKVYFNLNLRAGRVFEEYTDVVLCYENGRWRIDYSEALQLRAKSVLIEKQEFLLFGTLRDKDLREVLQLLVKTSPYSRISALTVWENKTYVSYGQIKHSLPFGSVSLNQPRTCITYTRRHGKWIPTCMASIESTYPNNWMSSPSTLLFFPQENVRHVQKLSKCVEWPEWCDEIVRDNLTDDDLRNIYTTAARFRGFEPFSELSLTMTKPGEVIVHPSSFADFVSGSVGLCKLDQRWVINWER